MHDKTVRGQYVAGRSAGRKCRRTYFEKHVDNDSDTETFVAIQAEIDNWRWAGVPFYLRTGKRMAKKCSEEIVIQFKRCRTAYSKAARPTACHQPAAGGTHHPAADGQEPRQGVQLTPSSWT